MSVKSSISIPLWRIIIKNSHPYVFLFILLFSITEIIGQEYNIPPDLELKHHMTAEEAKYKHLIGKDFIVTTPPVGPVRNVSEFDRMQGVLIRYPFGISYDVIKELADDINVVTVVEDQTEENYVLSQYVSAGVNTSNCDFLHAPTNSYWTRDYGPWYIFDGNDDPGIVDFPYNRPRPLDDEIPVEMANSLGINVFGMDITTAGGNYMTDGHGISSSSELVWEENPSLSEAEIDQLVNDYLGIGKYHVIPDPNNSYIDHIDCWGKFLDVDKVLIREVPATHAQYDEIEATAAYYASQTSAYGLPYQVFRVYTPNDQPYTNSLIINEKVIVPIMGSSWDDDAIQVYQDAMPGYEIVGYTGSWESTDALHCRAKGIADIGMLYIQHIPLLGNQPDLPDYQIQAEITAYSGLPIYPDSVFLIYKINGGEYDTLLMSYIGGKTYSGILSNPGLGSEIAYYLFAADQSGRSETHPLIGEPDPHVFYIGEPAYQNISINPNNINVTLPEESQTVENLYISNLGGLALNYSISKQYLTAQSKAYCSSQGGGSDEFIENVSIGSINNTSTQSNYTDYTSLSTDVEVGQSYSITITNGDPNWPTDQCGIWVDWNQNENFGDDEPIIVSGSPGVGPYTATITPPVDALPGMARMRVQIIYNATPDPCATFSYGEVEDYSLLVSNNFTDWLTINPLVGLVAGQDSTNINLTINSSGMDEGNYQAHVTITSNDPDQPELIIPVTLIVSGARYVDLTVFLEGAFFGTEMTTILNNTGLLPLTQPYNISPWNYSGSESVISIPNADITDWVLIEFRDATEAALATSQTIIEKQAAFLLNNGSIVGLDGASLLQLNNLPINELFAVICHRNHLGVMSANPLSINGNNYSYDFTSSPSSVFGGEDAHAEIAPGIWGMAASDGNADGTVNIIDKSDIWIMQVGLQGYLKGDYNLNTQIENSDKNDIWLPNVDKNSFIPD